MAEMVNRPHPPLPPDIGGVGGVRIKKNGIRSPSLVIGLEIFAAILAGIDCVK